MSDPSHISTETAQSYEHAIAWLYRDARDARTGRIRTAHAYRGLDDAAFTLETSLSRLQGEHTQIERALLRNFKKYAYHDVVDRDTDWHWLTVAQHHGVPTRLLDWTFSPLVALHFAVADLDHFNVDGVIWAVNFIQAHALLPDRLRDILAREHARVFDVDMLDQLRVEDPDLKFDTLSRLSAEDFLLFFQPPSLDERIVNQYALFSTLSNPRRALEDWLDIDQHRALARRLIIPAALKWDIRDMLDQSNVNERVLFPGLDGLGAWLKRYYSPKNLP